MYKFRKQSIKVFASILLIAMLCSCSLEKRVIVTTKNHEGTIWDSHNFNSDNFGDNSPFPRDTVINYKLR